MRYSPELAARAEAWLALPLEQKRGGDGRGLVELAELWAATQGVPVPDCIRQCKYSERVQEITRYVREYHRFTQHPDAMSESTYAFAPQFANETIADGRYNKTVTAETLTDDDAKALLKLGYGHVIVKKGQAEASGTGAAATEPSATEKKATEAATKAQKDASDSKAALKAEKDAHKATAKELTDTKKLLADSESKLTEVTNKLAEATKNTGSDAQ